MTEPNQPAPNEPPATPPPVAAGPAPVGPTPAGSPASPPAAAAAPKPAEPATFGTAPTPRPAARPAPAAPPQRTPPAAAPAPALSPGAHSAAEPGPGGQSPGVPAQASRSALPVLTAIGFIFVLLAVAWVWNSQIDLYKRLASLPPPPPPGVEAARVAALEGRLNALEQRITAQDQRLTAIENRPPPAPPPASPPPPAPEPSLGADQAAALTAQMTGLEARLKTAEQRQGTLAEQAAQAQRVQQALAALEVGEPLGDLPGAPPALARFAHAKPPTEAALRLAFPAAADAALAASRPSVDGKSLGERIMMHASSLVTVKQGGRVLIGAPAATVLGEAQARLEAGDLAGALAALDALDSAAAQAMAGWRGDARALLDARAALSKLARG